MKEREAIACLCKAFKFLRRVSVDFQLNALPFDLFFETHPTFST
jgi:hypothetical protein